ncbi:MAG: DUF1045 domain-containing protein [Streptosporangiales bacterium]|nr:DUF1045 domain-containing protein [Streptosporangiales bacterium]
MTRYAIYAAPGTGTADPAAIALRERAERWLGRAVSGAPVAPGVPDGWDRARVDAITADARRYGFHATLKAPFRLARGRTAAELDAAVARFAAGRAAARIPRLSLACLGAGFYALVPGDDAPGLRALAAETVTAFDAFRAPPTAAETARRHPERLSERQRELLAAWGYPYVLNEFRFHLTLTDPVPRNGGPRPSASCPAGSPAR